MSNKPLTEDQLIKALQANNLEIDKKLKANNLVLEALIDKKIKTNNDEIEKRIQTNNDELIDRFKEYFVSRYEVENIVEKVVDRKLREHVGALPTKDEFYEAMDKLMNEIKAERQENTIIDNRSTENRERIERIETHLDLSTNA